MKKKELLVQFCMSDPKLATLIKMYHGNIFLTMLHMFEVVSSCLVWREIVDFGEREAVISHCSWSTTHTFGSLRGHRPARLIIRRDPEARRLRPARISAQPLCASFRVYVTQYGRWQSAARPTLQGEPKTARRLSKPCGPAAPVSTGTGCRPP